VRRSTGKSESSHVLEFLFDLIRSCLDTYPSSLFLLLVLVVPSAASMVKIVYVSSRENRSDASNHASLHVIR
jgi:hypothetical protein